MNYRAEGVGRALASDDAGAMLFSDGLGGGVATERALPVDLSGKPAGRGEGQVAADGRLTFRFLARDVRRAERKLSARAVGADD